MATSSSSGTAINISAMSEGSNSDRESRKTSQRLSRINSWMSGRKSGPIMLHLDANACERLDSLAIGNLRVYQICMVLRRSAIASSSFGAFFCGLQCEFAKRLLQSSKIPNPPETFRALYDGSSQTVPRGSSRYDAQLKVELSSAGRRVGRWQIKVVLELA